jgi:hypothetical protein
MDGSTGQARSTCLKEVGAARAQARSNSLDNGEDAAALRANALARCAVHPPKARDACEQLARGQGQQSGSVRDGGVIKQLTTRTPDDAARPANPASGAAAASSNRAQTTP